VEREAIGGLHLGVRGRGVNGWGLGSLIVKIENLAVRVSAEQVP